MFLKASAAVMAVTSVVGLGWGGHGYLHGTFAEKEPVLVAGAQLDYILTQQEAGIVREIAALELLQRRRRLTPVELDTLKERREALKEARQVRKGK